MRICRLSAAAFFVASASCSTLVKDPGQARATNPVTVGMPGVLYHPGKSVGLLANFELPEAETTQVVSGGRGEGAYSMAGDDGSDERKINMRQMGARLSLLHFPSNNSFFFWGLTSRYEERRAGYVEHVTEYQSSDPHTARVEWIDRFGTAGLTIGTSVVSKIDSHFYTSLLGLSVEGRAAQKRSFVDDGAAKDVNGSQRDATLAAFDAVGRKAQFKYYYLAGFAF